MLRWVRVLALVTASLVGAGCIGATDRADFDDEVRRRGGGISVTWIDESLAAAATELNVAPPGAMEFLTLTINGTSRTLTINARRGDQPAFVDSVTVREGEVVAVAPIQDADELPLDELVVAVDDTPLADVEELVDAALAEFDETDAFVTTISITSNDGEPTTTFQLASERRTGSATFDATGQLVEVRR